MTMRRRCGGVAVVMLMLALGVSPGAAQTFTPRDEKAEDFPDHPGRALAFITCTPCHGFKLVAQQGQSRTQWEATLAYMTQRHSMPPLEGDDRKAVLDYLEAAFPPRTTPGGWQNPFLKK
jgi:hypothetical protein